MTLENRICARIVMVVLIFVLPAAGLRAQTGTASVRGRVSDPSGAIVPEASVNLTAQSGATQTATATAEGGYEFKNLPSGKYEITVMVSGFAPYTKDAVELSVGQSLVLNISLSVAAQKQQVTVSGEALSLDTASSSNASAVVLTQKELDALPDDPDELEADLQALAGPAAGPNGGQMYIDGFTAGQLPPKSSIREIRLNSNPFSSEYDTPGFGRIEIFTKPGANTWHGSFSANENQQALNTKNPFAASGADFQSNQLGGNVGGRLGKNISLFFNADYRKIDNTSVINALILDSNSNPVSYQALDPLPQSRLNVGPRFDWQVKKNNTFSLRYQYLRNTTTNNGVGNFVLPAQASNTLQVEDQLQATDSQYFGTRIVYETRFQYLHQMNNDVAANHIPSVTVPGAFTGGGGGNSLGIQNHYELQSYTSIALTKHFLKFGARIRVATDSNTSNSAFYGAFQFASLTAFQTMSAGLNKGMTMAQILTQPGCRTGGVSNGTCGPSQFSLTAGNPHAQINMIDAGPFIQDDWKLKPNLTLSYGLRFETQNHISDHMDWAPRIAIAWGIGGTQTRPEFVLRAGSGLFYTRFAEGNVLQALRQNGVTEQEYLVANPNFYCGPLTALGTTVATTCPTAASLSGTSASVPTIFQIAPSFHAPYMEQSNVTVEHQLTRAAQLSVTYLNAIGFDQLLVENVNSPVLPGTQTPTPACIPPANSGCGVYPNGVAENIYQYTSAGKFRQNQLFFNTTIRGRRLTLNAFYNINYTDSTPTAGLGGLAGGIGGAGFVSNPYNIGQDYGRAGGFFGVRHRVFLLANVPLPYRLNLSPMLMISSGMPYTITIGKDLLGTGEFNQRPGIITSATCPNTVITGTVYCTTLGTFDSVPKGGETIVPVNSLTGPAQFTVNLRLSRTFAFGRAPAGQARTGADGAGNGGFGGGGAPPAGPPPGGVSPPAGPPPGGGFGPPGFGGGTGGLEGRRFSFTASINARNVFNTVNLGTPVSNLTSPLFGQYESLSNTIGVPGGGGTAVANRQVYLQGTFSF